MRRQPNFPIVESLAISDYTSQGCTFGLGAILDLHVPRGGRFGDRNAYVMLSRVPSQELAVILRLFPLEWLLGVMKKGLDKDLDHDDRRLAKLADATVKRHRARTAAHNPM